MKRLARPFWVLVPLVGAVFLAWCHAAGTRIEGPHLRPTTETSSLHARFFGVSTLLLDDGIDAILIDGFFSRPGLSGFVTGFQPNEPKVKEVLAKNCVGKIRAVFVAHSHHDHVLDAGLVACDTGARLYGSKSVAKIAAKHAPSGQIVELAENKPEVVEVAGGKFKIRCIPTPHSAEPWPVRLFMALRFLPGVGQFPAGQNYAFHVQHGQTSLLIVPSAALPAGGMGNVSADVVFLSVAYLARQGETKICEYWQQCVAQTGAKVVVPIHWDNLFKDQLSPIPWPIDDIPAALATLRKRCAGDVTIAFMPALLPVKMPPEVPAAIAAKQ